MSSVTLNPSQETHPDQIPGVTFTLLLATDGTSFSNEALHNAINLVKNTEGRLIITYFADPEDKELFTIASNEGYSSWHAVGEKVLQKLAAEAREAGLVNIETVLEDYQGEESLGEIGRRYNANLVMLASHRFQGLEK